MARRRSREAGPSKLTIDCDICGEPMEVDRLRYVELVKAGQRPRCRRNGCERLCGAKSAVTSRMMEVLAETGVSPLMVLWPQTKNGRKNGALAKLAVKRETVEGCSGRSSSG